jgi:hypothetical protein
MMPSERYLAAFKELYSVCKEQEWGDPFSYARSREIHMAILLGHKVASTYAGADGFEPDGSPVEYKSTITDEINGTYNGISVQDTWEAQVAYLQNEKIGCYKHHYFARYAEDAIVEMWRLDGSKVLELLLPKIQRQFVKEKKGKDPRLGATLTRREIATHGEKIDIINFS